MTYVPTREGAQTKGRRYLVEGRLVVTEVAGDRIRATCRGQGTVYALAHHASQWFCSCPARTLCAHLVALQLVTVVNPEGETP